MNTDNTISKRLEILEASLIKKKEKFDRKWHEHHDDVKSANGQPLNDKRNGKSTLNRWGNQRRTIKNLEASIEKTKKAIDREKELISNVENQQFPDCLIPLINDGTLTQWRKYPNRFFIKEGGQARLIWDEKGKKFKYSHLDKCTGEQLEVFKKVALFVHSTYQESIEKS